ncbi:PREDICTED: zinc carboxypeptidase-like [Cyphomyrmex costatus]|uniref:Zinc carboxypeptidase A 1 n=1 Tax=Cyphomyrmex costatus TaxID=456900 RepID=A0A195CTS9_9HYME|nr:PREDICTED: zinc carboxypeptidase-like [Cyphomyrmex costatus]KYN04096.1 Zinc carboxypeptidase A 1 [Cyphomyrmex costatus]
MWKIIVLCAVVSLATGQKALYDNYKVFRMIPTTKTQLDILHEMENVYDGFSFWDSPTIVNKHVDLMVAPHKLPEFYEKMTEIGIPYQTHINDVQKLIDETVPKTQTRSGSFDFTNYHTLDEIYKNLDDLAKQYPDKVQTVVAGQTYEGREIKGVKVSFKDNNPGIFIEGGIHAREWISSATTMYILHQLLTSNNTDVRALAESHDWYIFPLFNPDGYVYTHTTNRLWRKTRKPYGFCKGSDPNRNWNYKWNTGGSSRNPCAETFAGSAPFSCIETKSASEYIKSISDKFYLYIAFHSYSQLLLFPYGHTRAHLENYDDLYAIAKKTITALKQRYGTSYVTGNVAEAIYIATGSSMDYVKGTFGTPIAYTYELRDTGRYGFLLPPAQIIPTGEEVVDSLVAMSKEAAARGYYKK